MTTTSTQPEARVSFAEGEVSTPRLRTSARRAVFWIVVAVILVLLGLLGLATAGAPTSASTLSATNPGAKGAEALARVLGNDGVIVLTADRLTSAKRIADAHPTATTVMVYDPASILNDAQLRSLKSIAGNLVLILPTAHELTILAPRVSLAGVVDDTAKAGCDYGPARRAGTVSGLTQGYRIAARGATAQSAAATGCFGTGGVHSLVRVVGSAQTVTVIGSTTTFTNQSIVMNGNAALGLGVFGSTDRLVWYRPSLADVSGVTPDGVIPNPPWVALAIALAAVVLVAAGVWRGRRLGPVVVERMPVTVRSSETLEGRARLYQRGSARGHALDALRIGTISRISILCGLPTVASVDEVIGAVSSLTGRSSAALLDLLLDRAPTSDAQLVHLSDQLTLLESEVRDAVVAFVN